MTSLESDEEKVNLSNLLEPAQKLVSEIDGGQSNTVSIQPQLKSCIAELEKLTRLVNQLALFSSNELVDDVPTDSLGFLLIPCYLGVLHQNLVAPAMNKIVELQKAKIYFHSFLKRARDLTIIETRLTWEDEDQELKEPVPKLSGEQVRKLKLERHRRKQELRAVEDRIRHQIQGTNPDDATLRELLMTRINYWCEKSFEELQLIEEELPLLKMMAERPEGAAPPPRPTPQGSMKPFIIARNEQQKQVFGIGYPSVPTMTVDEWYQQKFGDGKAPPPGQTSHSTETKEVDEESESEDEQRANDLRMDEYKDSHRRGWGNTHNKG